jgi:hypothetical protein
VTLGEAVKRIDAAIAAGTVPAEARPIWVAVAKATAR